MNEQMGINTHFRDEISERTGRFLLKKFNLSALSRSTGRKPLPGCGFIVLYGDKKTNPINSPLRGLIQEIPHDGGQNDDNG